MLTLQQHQVPSANFKELTISDFNQYIDKHKPHPAPTTLDKTIILADNKATAMSLARDERFTKQIELGESMSFSPEMIKSDTYKLTMEIFSGGASLFESQ